MTSQDSLSSEKFIPEIDQQRAVLLLEEALARIQHKPPNHGHRGWQCGGAYWRLAQVLKYYLEPQLAEQEGEQHAAFLIKTHGQVIVATEVE
jgi:hypothetical protein